MMLVTLSTYETNHMGSDRAHAGLIITCFYFLIVSKITVLICGYFSLDWTRDYSVDGSEHFQKFVFL